MTILLTIITKLTFAYTRVKGNINNVDLRRSIMEGDWVMSIKKTFSSLLKATAVFAILVGTYMSVDKAEAGKDTMVIAIGGLPQGIDLDKHVSPTTWSMGAQVMEDGMSWEWVDFPFKTGDGWDPSTISGFAYPDYFGAQKLVPGIIEKCDLDADGKRAVYHLRKGVISPWGNEFTADDMLWRIERGKATGAINNFLEFLLNLPGQTINPPESGGYAKIDSHTVEITSSAGMPLACKRFTNYYDAFLDSTEVMKHATEDDPWADKWVATNGGGFGAYKITEWSPGKRVVMESNEQYWRGAPEIKKIIYLVVPESANRVALLQQGKVHMAEGLTPDEILSLDSSDKARGVAVRGNQSMWVVINNTLPPYDNVKVRRAINHLIDRKAIAGNIYHGMMNVWQGVMPSTYPGYDEWLKYDYNIEKAKALLAEAGFADGFDAEFAFSAAEATQESIAILLQSAFKAAGINLTLKKLPVAAHSDLIMSKKASLGLWTDMPIQPDINYALKLVWPTNALVNYHNFSDEKVDATLKKCEGVVDPAARIECHAGIQEHIHDRAPLGWIGEQYFAVGLSRAVSGFRWYTTQYYHVNEMSIAE